jgi:hypothetical protein
LTDYRRASKNAYGQVQRLEEAIAKVIRQLGALFAQLAAKGDKRITNNGRAVAGFFLVSPIRGKMPLVTLLHEGSMLSAAGAARIVSCLTACAQLVQDEALQQEVSTTGVTPCACIQSAAVTWQSITSFEKHPLDSIRCCC